jgi:hypothetical protein
MARLVYLRAPSPLPQDDDIEALAAYWKKYYNTDLGAGKVQDFIKHYSTLADETI